MAESPGRVVCSFPRRSRKANPLWVVLGALLATSIACTLTVHAQSIATEREVADRIWAGQAAFMQLDPFFKNCIYGLEELLAQKASQAEKDPDARYGWTVDFLRNAPSCIVRRIRARHQPGSELSPETLAKLHESLRSYNAARAQLFPSEERAKAVRRTEPMAFEFQTFVEDQAKLRDRGTLTWVQWRARVRERYGDFHPEPMPGWRAEAYDYADLVAAEVDAGRVDVKSGQSLISGMLRVVEAHLRAEQSGRTRATVTGGDCSGASVALVYWCRPGIPPERCNIAKARRSKVCPPGAPS